MSEKNPYELRKDILDLAYKVVNSQHEQQKKYLELQQQILLNMMELETEAQDQMDKMLKSSWEETNKTLKALKIPTMEDVMNTAKVFQQFVNSKQ